MIIPSVQQDPDDDTADKQRRGQEDPKEQRQPILSPFKRGVGALIGNEDSAPDKEPGKGGEQDKRGDETGSAHKYLRKSWNDGMLYF